VANVCITGARGFIGRHLARALADDGHSVAGLGHGAWPGSASAGVDHWLQGEIDAPNLSALADRAGGFDTIHHLAGGSAVGPSFVQPRDDFERTLATTARLLDWMRQFAPATRLVTASSAAVYGNAGAGEATETAPLAPTSPYGTHKAMLEALVASYRRHFAVKASVVRLFSVYGRGLEKQLLFELCRRCAAAGPGTEIGLGGTGQERRDWLHVSDAVALLRLAAASDAPPILNGGTGVPTEVAVIADMVCREWGKDLRPVFSGVTREGDPANLVADPDLARAAGFIATTRVADGVPDYVAWFRHTWQ
jgi:UDP-glucose 4-epimerase